MIREVAAEEMNLALAVSDVVLSPLRFLLIHFRSDHAVGQTMRWRSALADSLVGPWRSAWAAQSLHSCLAHEWIDDELPLEYSFSWCAGACRICYRDLGYGLDVGGVCRLSLLPLLAHVSRKDHWDSIKAVCCRLASDFAVSLLDGLCGDSCCISSQSITGRADDNHHDIHSWMLEASSGQLLGHVDDGEE